MTITDGTCAGADLDPARDALAATLTVPARTTAVFEQLLSGAQGAGLHCNPR
jgi:hypothetical protein